MSQPDCPSLYQIDTRQWISQLSEKISGLFTLDDIPNSELEKFCRSGLRWIWQTNVWQTGCDLREMNVAEKLAITWSRCQLKFS